jgi:hypothetical protein
MTLLAVRDNHFSRVRFVALGAIRFLPVYAVTGGTVQGSMPALVLPELGNLLSMTAETGVRDIASKRNVQRYVGVFVAVQTARDLEMWLPHVALVALRDRFLHCGGMS